jgi:hypothetical protein
LVKCTDIFPYLFQIALANKIARVVWVT